ncbi:MAG: CoA transferase, partial [Eggerthellaceae bacterium]
MKGLEGIKVVELTGYVAAPACPRILGEMGATIYKIEPFSGDE